MLFIVINIYVMNYKLVYERLVKRGQERSIIEGYKEVHHIIPKCIGGNDSVDNLVVLTPEEHYVAHQLLVKIYPGNIRLVRACDVMSKDTKVNKYWRRNKMYGWLRRRLHVPEIDIKCKQCGNTFQALKCLKRKFCSQDCKNKNQERETTLCCKGCKKNFKIMPSKAKRRQYCSPKCSKKWRYIRTGQSVKWVCPKCNKELFVNKYLVNNKKHCSRTCQLA
jgi:hypothetical protein